MNPHEAKKKAHTASLSCFVRLRLLSRIAPASNQAIRFVILLVTMLVLNVPLDSRGQRPNEGVKPRITFVEVPPKASGIGWVHANAHSPERFLPETVGAGGAF